MHSSAGYRLVAVHQLFAFPECIEHHGHGAQVQRAGSDVHEVIEDTGDLIEHRADVLCPDGRLDSQKGFNRTYVGVFIAHHGYVVQPIHVADGLVEGLGLRQLFGTPVQQAHMRIRAHNGLAIHLKHKAQYPMCRRMLGAEVHHVVPDLGIPPITAHGSGAARRRPLHVHPIASVDRTHSAEVLNAPNVDATSTWKAGYGLLGLECACAALQPTALSARTEHAPSPARSNCSSNASIAGVRTAALRISRKLAAGSTGRPSPLPAIIRPSWMSS